MKVVRHYNSSNEIILLLIVKENGIEQNLLFRFVQLFSQLRIRICKVNASRRLHVRQVLALQLKIRNRIDPIRMLDHDLETRGGQPPCCLLTLLGFFSSRNVLSTGK